MALDGATVLLFSYGTLQPPEVERGTFGRVLEGEPDSLCGFVLRPLKITDERVVELSGADVHSVACSTRNVTDEVQGVYLKSAKRNSVRLTPAAL